MEASQYARSYFERGCNCAQAVLAAIGPQFDLTPEQCMKIAAAFGGGIARRGELCGAVSGALMLLGLKHGGSPIGDPSLKEEVHRQTEQFLAAFTQCHGSVICRDLLGCDLSTPEGRAHAHAHELAKTVCPNFVQTAVELFLQQG